MSTFAFGLGATTVYIIGWIATIFALYNREALKNNLLQTIALIAIVLHAVVAFQLLSKDGGLDLSLTKVIALLALVINLLVYFSRLRKPIHSLYLALFPISAATLLVALFSTSTKATIFVPLGLQAHILISILAYSFLAIAALQALLVGYQNWQLKHKHQDILMRTMPALETMESLLFKLIWVGEILLTISLITGFYQYDDFFAQQLIHKVAFSIVAWAVYAVLLFGRHFYGWRGRRAINWTWVGFSGILLGYIGSKVVIELILN